MWCPICNEEMERGDFDLEIYSFWDRKTREEVKITRPAAVYECSCGARWVWVRGRRGLKLVQKPFNRDVVSEFERRERISVYDPEDNE